VDLHASGSAKAATWQRQFGVAQKIGEGKRERKKQHDKEQRTAGLDVR